MKNIIYIVSLALVFGCITSKSDMKIGSNNRKSIEATIEIARVEISCHLKKGGINPEENQMIFKSRGQSVGNGEEERCWIFHKQAGYDFINQNITL